MHLSKLIGFFPSLGASLAVAISSIVATSTIVEAKTNDSPHPLGLPEKIAQSSPKDLAPLSLLPTLMPNPVSPDTKPVTDGEVHRENVAKNVAENPFCSLVSETIANPLQEPNQNVAAQVPAKFSGFVSGFLRKLMRVIGLGRFVQKQQVPDPTVAVIPQPSPSSTGIRREKQSPSQSNVRLVSNHPVKPTTQAQEYQLWVQGHFIADIRTREKADLLAQILERLVDSSSFSAASIAPKLQQNQPAIAMGEQILFVIDDSLTNEDRVNYEILAIQWANNLRLAFDVPALDLITAQQQMYQVEETTASVEGLASWYGPYFHGRQTANGEIYNQFALTAAHPSMPLNTYLKVTNLNNDKSVIIRLNDRGPYIQPRSLDLSLGAAQCLDSVTKGVIPYKATVMKRRPAIATAAI